MDKHTVKKIAAAITALLMLYVGIRYSGLTATRQIAPVLATWLLFCVSTMLCFWTYWSTEEHDPVSNIANTVDCVICWMILATMLWVGNCHWGFNDFEIACLIGTGVILLFWRLTKHHIAANLSLQFIIVVGYFPTMYHLWYASRNTEAFGPWVTIWFAALTAIVPGVIARDRLAIIYASRGLVLVTIVLVLMIRLDPTGFNNFLRGWSM